MTNTASAIDLTPIGDRLLVELETQGMVGGLHVPDNAASVLETGFVVARGPGRMLESGTYADMGIDVGDRIMFTLRGGNFAATEVRLGSARYFLVPHTAVVGVFRRGATSAAAQSILVS